MRGRLLKGGWQTCLAEAPTVVATKALTTAAPATDVRAAIPSAVHIRSRALDTQLSSRIAIYVSW